MLASSAEHASTLARLSRIAFTSYPETTGELRLWSYPSMISLPSNVLAHEPPAETWQGGEVRHRRAWPPDAYGRVRGHDRWSQVARARRMAVAESRKRFGTPSYAEPIWNAACAGDQSIASWGSFGGGPAPTGATANRITTHLIAQRSSSADQRWYQRFTFTKEI